MRERKIRKIQEPIESCSIWGWSDRAEVILDIYSSMDESLLSENLIFAWQDEGKELRQLVIVRNPGDYVTYSVGIMTSESTDVLSGVLLEYLQSELLEDLIEKYKLRTDIIESYKQILKNEITSD